MATAKQQGQAAAWEYGLTEELYRNRQSWTSDNDYNTWLRQFNSTNEYNDPSAQVQRLMAAGLNPSLASDSGQYTGQGVSNTTAPTPHGSFSPDTTAAQLSSLAQLTDSAAKLWDRSDYNPSVELARKTLDGNVYQQALSIRSQELGNQLQSMSNTMMSAKIPYAARHAYNDMLKSYYEVQNAAVQGDNIQMDTFNRYYDALQKQLSGEKASVETQMMRLQLPYVRQQMVAEIDNLRQQSAYYKSSATERDNAAEKLRIENAIKGIQADALSNPSVRLNAITFLEGRLNGLNQHGDYKAGVQLGDKELQQLKSALDKAKKQDDNMWLLRFWQSADNILSSAALVALFRGIGPAKAATTAPATSATSVGGVPYMPQSIVPFY